VHSDGAVLVPAPEHTEGEASLAPLVVRKSDGTYGYASTDLAALQTRVQEAHEWLVYVVDRSQGAHLRAVFAAARAAGYLPEAVRATHLPFGVVRGESGAKLASRDGAPLALAQLLHEAVAEATRALTATRSLLAAETHASDAGRRAGMDASGALEADADALGIAAVKYFELAQHPLSDYVFSLPRVMALRGNTALYLNYATARIAALKRRASAGSAQGASDDTLAAVEGDEEEALALKLAQFGEAVQAAEAELAPSHLCTYLFELAQRFHSFYDACRIVGHARHAQRMALAHATQLVLEQGFALLGLRAAQRI
jgi:arginyl-tRNA synthetase